MQEHDAGASGAGKPSLDPAVSEALTELGTRLEQQGIHARVWVHDGMTVAMTHRDGDTTATVDEALVDGTNLIEDRGHCGNSRRECTGYDLALSDARRALVLIRAGIARGCTPDESLSIASTVRPST